MRSRNLLFLCLCFCGAVFATTADNKQPVVITSHSLSGDLNKHLAVFSGNVVATQGTRQLLSDQTFVTFNDSGKIMNLRAVGNPAKSTEVLDDQGNRVFGQALTIEYFPPKSFIEYEQEAILQEHGNIFKGNLITYNITNQVIASPMAAGNKGAATIVLPPSGATTTNKS